MEIFLGMLLKPFFAFLLLLVAWPFKWLVQQLPDNRLRRLLLSRVGGATPPPAGLSQ
jgi:hypothetical protein